MMDKKLLLTVTKETLIKPIETHSLDEEFFRIGDVFSASSILCSNSKIEEIEINIKKLEKILYEWRMLKEMKGDEIEFEIMKFFDERLPETTFAFSEIRSGIGDTASIQTIIHKLNNLVKSGILSKPGRGTYRRKHL